MTSHMFHSSTHSQRGVLRGTSHLGLVVSGCDLGQSVCSDPGRSITCSPRKSSQILRTSPRRRSPDVRVEFKLLALSDRPKSESDLLGIFMLSCRVDG